MGCEWTYTTTKYNLEDWEGYIIWKIFLLPQVLSKSKVLYILELETERIQNEQMLEWEEMA